MRTQSAVRTAGLPPFGPRRTPQRPTHERVPRCTWSALTTWAGSDIVASPSVRRAGAPMPKQYDQAYFDRWYRHPRHRVKSDDALVRKVRMVLAIAEWYLEHPVRSVLDVGCGEAPWFPILRMLRPKLDYLGLDPSSYAVERYGASRNVRLCRFGDLEQQRFDRPVDLLVCADVMHYVPSAELLRGLSGFRELCDGVAYLEVMCKGDDFVGDREGWIGRTPAWYRKAFAAAGFTACGSHCYLGPRLRQPAMALELAG